MTRDRGSDDHDRGDGETLPPRLGEGEGRTGDLLRAALRGRRAGGEVAEPLAWDRLVEGLAQRDARLGPRLALAAAGGALASAVALTLLVPRVETPPRSTARLETESPSVPAPVKGGRAEAAMVAHASAGPTPTAASRAPTPSPPSVPTPSPVPSSSPLSPSAAALPSSASPSPPPPLPPSLRPRRLRFGVAPAQATPTPLAASAAAPAVDLPPPPAATPLDTELALYESARARIDQAGGAEPALRAFLELRRQFPAGALRGEVDLSIVELLPRLGRYDEALRESAALLAARPGGERAADLRLLRGNLYREALRDPARAEAEYARAEAASAGAPGGSASTAEAAFWRAVCLEQLARPAEAADALRRYLASPGRPRAGEARARLNALDAPAREHAPPARLQER